MAYGRVWHIITACFLRYSRLTSQIPPPLGTWPGVLVLLWSCLHSALVIHAAGLMGYHLGSEPPCIFLGLIAPDCRSGFGRIPRGQRPIARFMG
jgi:hypothetical protein